MSRRLLTLSLAIMVTAITFMTAHAHAQAPDPRTRLDILLEAAKGSGAKPDDYRNPLCSWRTAGVCTRSGPRTDPLALSQKPYLAFVDPEASEYVRSLARRLAAPIGVGGQARIVVAPCGQPNARSYDDDFIVVCSEAVAAAYGPDGENGQRSEDALAWIVAHELAHVLLGNFESSVQAKRGFGLVSMFESIGALVLAGPFLLVEGRKDEATRPERFSKAMLKVSAATRMLERATIRAELDADMIGVDLLVRSGWSSRAAFIGLGITTGDIHSTYRAPRHWLEGRSPLTAQERRASLKAYIGTHYAGAQPPLTTSPGLALAAAGLAKSANVVFWAQDNYRNYAFFFYCGEGSAGWVVDTALSFDPLKPYRCSQLVGLRRSVARRLASASATTVRRGAPTRAKAVQFANGFWLRTTVADGGLCETYVYQPGQSTAGEAPENYSAAERLQLQSTADILVGALPPTATCPRLRVAGWGRAGAVSVLASLTGRRTGRRIFDAMVFEVPWRDLVGEQYLPFVSVTQRAQPQLEVPTKQMPSGPSEVWVNPHSTRAGLAGMIEDLARAAPG